MNQEILFSEDWQEYRELEIALGAKIIHEMWKNNADPVYIRGAMEMLRCIVRIPEGLAKTDEAKAAAQALIQAAMHKVDMSLLRKTLSENG